VLIKICLRTVSTVLCEVEEKGEVTRKLTRSQVSSPFVQFEAR
jgi:hypothetical protein